MKNERIYLKCEICGNIIGMIEDSGISVVCCGQDMTLLTPNTVDAAHEKHIPVAKWEDGKLVVTVGSTAHPMTEEHFIAWIAVAQGKLTQRVSLDHVGAPTATFLMDKTPCYGLRLLQPSRVVGCGGLSGLPSFLHPKEHMELYWRRFEKTIFERGCI